MKLTQMRAISLALAAVMLISASGCGKPADTPLPDSAAVVENAPESTEQRAPSRGFPDYTNNPNASALDAYRKNDWAGEWIWTESCQDDSYVAFRKTFTLDEAVPSATAYISSVDQYCLWVNGVLTVLDGCPRRGATPVDCYYDTVEITNLKAGANTVAVLVAFNGRSGDGSVVPALVDEDGFEANQAGLIFEMHAGGVTVASDATWKATRHNAYKNRVTGGADYPRYEQASQLAERNVCYFACDDIGSFYAPDYDDSEWKSAFPVSRAGELPFGGLYDGIISVMSFGEPTDFPDATDYIGKPLSENSVIELSLPGNVQFDWLIELDAPEGKRLTVYTDTYEDRNGAKNFKDTYITSSGAQSYENYPWRTGSKLIIEAEAGVSFKKIAYRLSGYPSLPSGAFSSSDEALAQLWRECQNTIAICARDTFMDCPDRERGPYMGDASNEIDSALYGFDDGMLALAKKTILACVSWTPDTGAIPSRAPSVKPHEIPNQSLAFASAAYHYWLHSGDEETMRAYYSVLVPYLRLYEMGENGIPLYREGSWTWTDWGKYVDSELLQVGFYYYTLSLAEKLAEELGIAEDAEFLADRMSEMKENWRSVYTAEDGFRSSGVSFVDDRANAMLALSGLADESDYPQIAEVLSNTREASPFMEKYVLEALCQMGYYELASERMRERYAPMLTDDWDTIWELFNDETGTYNHAWSTGPIYILAKYFAGIRPTGAGWESYEIAPSDALGSFTCEIETVKGSIRVELEADGEKKVLRLHTVPGSCTVLLPDSFGADFTVDGGDFVIEDGSILLSEAGDYTFRTF